MNITIGRYLDVDSIIHRLNPKVKFLGFLVLIVLLFLSNAWYYYVALAGVVFVIAMLARIPLKIVWQGIYSLRFLILIMFVFNLFFSQTGNLLWEFGFIKIYDESLVRVTVLIVRLVLMITLASILTLTTKPLDLTAGLEDLMQPLKVVCFPAGDVALMISIALRFIPTLTDEADKIMKAQASRGASLSEGKIATRIRHFVSLLIPLFVISFRRAENLGIAMEARGYRTSEGRTRLYELKWTRLDVWAMAILAVVSVAFVALAFLV